MACPSDKNLPGCPCTQGGQTAACWTGYRADRSHGDCQDGMTTCTATPAGLEWAACNGEVLPRSGGTLAQACACFSKQTWTLANTEPCFMDETDMFGDQVLTAYASTPGSPPTCPFDASTGLPTIPAVWSDDTLSADCTGEWTLCMTLKAGDPNNPQPTDCVVGQSCATGHYDVGGQVQTWPGLPGWQSDPSATKCVEQFVQRGGYGEMSVQGQSDECVSVGEVFNRITYCSSACGASCTC